TGRSTADRGGGPARCRVLNAGGAPGPRGAGGPWSRDTLAPMIRRAFPLPVVLLPLAIAARASQATAPPSDPVPAQVEPAEPAAPAAPAQALLPKVPQPPERPVAPPSVTDPAIPREQRIEAFVDYTAQAYGVDRQLVRDTLAQAEYKQAIIDAISRPA